MIDRLDPAELRALWDFGDPVASEARFRERIAGEIADSTIALELQTQVARAQGLQGRFEDAVATLDVIPDGAPVVEARIALERGRIANSGGDPESAAPHFTRAVDLARLAESDELVIDALHMLAIADTANAAMWAQRGLDAIAVSADPGVQRWRGAFHNNLGWTYHDAGDYPAALTAFEAALATYEETDTPFQVHVAWWSIARCLRSVGRLEEALEIQRRLAAEDEPDAYVTEEIATLEAALGH